VVVVQRGDLVAQVMGTRVVQQGHPRRVGDVARPVAGRVERETLLPGRLAGQSRVRPVERPAPVPLQPVQPVVVVSGIFRTLGLSRWWRS
jgi:hypothetical protein